MYYCCPFKERYLVDEIQKSSQQYVLQESYNFFKDKDYESAYALLDGLIQKEDGLALVLASLFSRPGELEEDFYKRHFDNILKASEKENPLALYSLGVYFDTGEYVEEDKEKAFVLFKSAADLGMPQAKHIYGVMQYYGTGWAEKNMDSALIMIKQASKEGVAEATEFLDYIDKKERG